MDPSKLLLLTLLLVFSLLLSGIGAEDVVLEPETQDSALKLEIESLRLKISDLESSVADKTRELKSKDDSLAEIEKIIKEKSDIIDSLQREIETIQKKGALSAAELLEKAHAWSAGLEKQIETLKSELQSQTQKKDTLEAHATGAEKKIDELSSKLERLQRTSTEQKQRIQKTERLLKAAEDELMKVKMEAASKKKELAEVHGAWLPTWLAIHLDYCQEYAMIKWFIHGKPAMDSVLQKASKISAQAQKHAEPYLDAIKDKWLPALKEQWMSFSTFIDPHVQHVSTKTVEFYKASLTAVSPHVVKVQEMAHPYFQEAKKLSRPYIDLVATASKPHVEKVRITLKPYTKKVVRSYKTFLKSATTYHHQVQAFAHEELKKHELTKALATKELVWFMASAFLALPVYLLYTIIASFFCKKQSKPTRSTQASHTHRRPKRRHAEK